MNHSALSAILKQHKLWLESDGKEGKCADLRYADLCCANLSYANLSSANLRNADLRNANIRYADLCCANLRYADLSNANLSYADLRYADLCDADLRCANLSYADLRYADLDFSCLPLWCGSLKTHFDDRQIIQFLYHTLSVVQNSKNASEGLKKALLTETNVILANSFHRAAECGVIKIYEQSGEERIDYGEVNRKRPTVD